MARSIIQFVCFKTSYNEQRFLPAWEPFASAFLARGLERIVLSRSLQPEGEYGFISRNLWDDQSFAATFPNGLPGDAGGFGIIAVQAGGFRMVAGPRAQLHEARRGLVKAIGLVEFKPDVSTATAGLQSVLAALSWEEADWALFESALPRWNGRYGAVIEAFALPADAKSMLTDLKQAALEVQSIRNVDLALYNEFSVLP